MAPSTDAHAPIAVYDSGIGGLSILKALREALPQERFIYFADSGYAPYGEKSQDFVAERAQTVTEQLLAEHDIKALVVACNTATAAGIEQLRLKYPMLPLVGVEPAIKPAVASSRTKHVAVLATKGTLQSARYQNLERIYFGQAQFYPVPCVGLMEAIEHEAITGDATQTQALCEKYVRSAGVLGTQSGEIDTLVLGCTHYPLAMTQWRTIAGDDVNIIDTGAAVATQTRRVLNNVQLLIARQQPPAPPPALRLLSSGSTDALHAAARLWLNW